MTFTTSGMVRPLRRRIWPSVIGAIGDGAATAEPGDRAARPTAGSSRCAPSGGGRGDLVVEFDRAATEALTKRVMGMDDEPAARRWSSTRSRNCARRPPARWCSRRRWSASSSPSSRSSARGRRGTGVGAGADCDRRTSRRCRCGCGAISRSSRAARRARSRSAVAPRRPRRLPAAPATPKLDVILDIDLPLIVRFGRTEMPLRAHRGARSRLGHRSRALAGRPGRRARQQPARRARRSRHRRRQLRRAHHRRHRARRNGVRSLEG